VAEVRIGWRDAWLPALLVVLGAAELASVGMHRWGAAVGLEAVAGMLLVFRRRYPLAVGPISAATLLAIPWLGPRLDEVATPILFIILAIFSLGRWVADLRGLAGLVAILGLFAVDYTSVDARDHNWTDVVFVLSLAVPPYVFGRIVGRLDHQRRLLAEQQDLIRDQAVAAERERIARELHDVIAHSLSAMVVQTAAAQDLLRSSPDRAAELLKSVADTGRRALQETGHLLHLIRDDADEFGLRPAPGLRDVPALVDTFRADGLPVEARLDLPDPGLPSGVDVSGYRVVQELLTNARRYADGPVQLAVSAEPQRLRISCGNSVGRGRAAAGSGLGLRGLAERVALLGGTLARTDEDGRFAVEVDIPLVREVVP
jgi:signal transduction histidine kinase